MQLSSPSRLSDCGTDVGLRQFQLSHRSSRTTELLLEPARCVGDPCLFLGRDLHATEPLDGKIANQAQKAGNANCNQLPQHKSSPLGRREGPLARIARLAEIAGQGPPTVSW